MPVEKSDQKAKDMNSKQTKTIYVVFSKTGTGIGKMICALTQSYYNHVSISFNKDLRTMYSFGRRYKNSPLAGGFIVERPTRYLANGNDIEVKVCRVELCPAEYARLRSLLVDFYRHRDDILYNTFGALCSLVGRRGYIPDAYTCIDFVTYALGISGVLNIGELECLLADHVVYRGHLKGIVHHCKWQGKYFEHQGKWRVCWGTAAHFSRLIGRACGNAWHKRHAK